MQFKGPLLFLPLDGRGLEHVAPSRIEIHGYDSAGSGGKWQGIKQGLESVDVCWKSYIVMVSRAGSFATVSECLAQELRKANSSTSYVPNTNIMLTTRCDYQL